MADLLDIETALANICGAVIYPLGTGQPSAAGIDCKIFPGWPNETELAASLLAGVAEISIYSGQNLERVTTRFMRDWSDLSKTPATITAKVAGNVITLSGTISVGHYVTIIIDGQAVSYAALITDTLTTMATNLAALMPAPFGATSLGAVITVGATYSGLIVARTAAPGTISREISRQERGMLVTIWAPSPQARASIATLLMTAILKIDFLALPDGSAAWLRYRQSNESDGKENAMAYRRDIGLWVEYANIETAIGYPITAPIVTQTLSPYLPPSANPAAPTGAIVLTFGASGGNPTGLVVYEIIAASSGAQNINVGQSISKIDSLYLNGVRQAQGQVTFIGTTVTLPAGLGIISGDLITIIFS